MPLEDHSSRCDGSQLDFRLVTSPRLITADLITRGLPAHSWSLNLVRKTRALHPRSGSSRRAGLSWSEQPYQRLLLAGVPVRAIIDSRVKGFSLRWTSSATYLPTSDQS